jgi:hypothetical protein
VRHLEGLRCVFADDIATGQDALALGHYGDADAIITNPPCELKPPANATHGLTRSDRSPH